MDVTLDVGSRVKMILREAWLIFCSAPLQFAVYVIILSPLAVMVDMGQFPEWVDFVVVLVTTVAYYFLLVAVIKNAGLANDGLAGGFWLYFGVAFLSNLAIGFGVLLLLIPGVIMLVRWAPVYGITLVEGGSVADGLGSAWDATRRHFWPILISMFVPLGLGLISLSIYLVAGFAEGLGVSMAIAEGEYLRLLPAVIVNFANFASTLVTMSIGLAVYSLLRGRSEQLKEVFG